MPCDKVMKLPLEERLLIESLSNTTIMPKEVVEYSMRINPNTKKVEYQIPPNEEWVYES